MSEFNIPKVFIIIKGGKVHLYCSRKFIPEIQEFKKKIEEMGFEVIVEEPKYYEHNDDVIACALDHFDNHE